MKNQELTLKYRRLDKEICDHFENRNRKKSDDDVFIPDISEKSRLENNADRLTEKVLALSAPGPVYEIIKSHFHDYILGGRAGIKSMYERPGTYIQAMLYSYTFHSRQDRRSADERAELASKKLARSGDVADGGRSCLDSVKPVYLQELVDTIDNTVETFRFERGQIGPCFTGLSERGIKSLESAIDGCCSVLECFLTETKKLLAEKGIAVVGLSQDSDIIKLPEEEYRSLLRDELGVNLDELLAWHEQEIEKTRAEVFEIGSRLKMADKAPSTMKEANDILLKYAGPCDTPEEMFRRANGYIKRTQAACRDFCYLPEGEDCRVVTVPEQLKLSYPWGGYGGGDKDRRPLLGEMFLNNHNFKAVTDGWIKMNTIHEAYPGHHVQFLRTTVDPLPQTVKNGARHVPISEGTAHRSERLFEFVFAEDQFFPLFVAYRRHHTSVRIKADLYLRYFGRPIGDAVKLYMDELGFDRITARGQVKAQEGMQGYFTTYYYGLKNLLDFEKKYGFSEKEYTEMLFAAGRISLENFEAFLKLSPEYRKSYLNDFKSIEQFGE